MPTAEVIHGDALAMLKELPDRIAAGVVTDPPYSSGGAFRGDRHASTETKYSGWSQNEDGSSRNPTAAYSEFTGDTRDQRAYLTWFSLWAEECLRVCKPGAHFLTFTDWRQLPTMTDAVQVAGWVWRGLAVWDKGIGRPMRGRFRNHLEYIVWATNGPCANPEEVYLPSLFRVAPPAVTSRQHRTEKPVELVRELLQLIPSGGLVLDPFLGSGTTAVACIQTGRRCIGIERLAEYVAMSRHRIDEAEGVGSLFDSSQLPAETPLFAGVA